MAWVVVGITTEFVRFQVNAGAVLHRDDFALPSFARLQGKLCGQSFPFGFSPQRVREDAAILGRSTPVISRVKIFGAVEDVCRGCEVAIKFSA